jgi:hypothetical protein
MSSNMILEEQFYNTNEIEKENPKLLKVPKKKQRNNRNS